MCAPRSTFPWPPARVGAAALLLIGAAILLGVQPAGADASTVAGSAFGIAGPSGPLGAPVPAGVSGTASDPAAGFGPAAFATMVLSIAPVNGWNRLDVTTRQVAGSAWS